VDNSGNRSLTNKVLVQYVVTNRLQLAITGKGTLSPNYSNAWLNIGQKYSLTATPTKGFVFSNWTGGYATNKPTLGFMMQSNLALTANFTETNRPTLTITTPANNARLGSNSVTMTGKATDAWLVTNVSYTVNSGAWNSASTANNYSNWTAIVSLAAGTNTVQIFAQNRGGLCSTTNTLKVIATNQITLNLVLSAQNLPAVQSKAMATAATVNRGFGFSLKLSAAVSGHIEYSTDLQHWTTWTNFDGTSTNLQFNDPQAVEPNRFYRAVTP